MAILTRANINVDQQEARIFCLGMTYVGIAVMNAPGMTWSGTLSCSMSQQTFGYTGPGQGAGSWIGTSVYPYNTAPISANGIGNIGGPQALTGQTGITANGNWFWPVQNATMFRVLYTQGTGTPGPNIVLAASIDSSWGDAFLFQGSTFGNKFMTNVANGQKNTLNIASDPYFGRRIRWITISTVADSGFQGSSLGPANAVWATNPALQVFDGNTVIYNQDLNTALPQQYQVPLSTAQQELLGILGGGLYLATGNAGKIVLASPGAGITTCINTEIATA